ncbi:hypothetical protein NGA_0133700, partial [Nannochloropsis gaditana CCMP526]
MILDLEEKPHTMPP